MTIIKQEVEVCQKLTEVGQQLLQTEEVSLVILTSDFKLIVFLGFQQWVRKAMPRKLLSELRQNVMGHKAYRTHQCIENIA